MDWELKSVLDYFDNRYQNSIWEYSQKFDALSPQEKTESARKMCSRITGHLNQLKSNHETVQTVVNIIIDDIYRSANTLYYYNDGILDYLQVTALPVFRWVSEYGLQVHYMTNNTFTDCYRPLFLFDKIFMASGVKYICPQHIAWLIMSKLDIQYEDYYAMLPSFLDAARVQRDHMLENCFKHGISYVHLDIDGDDAQFEASIQYCNKDGHLVIFRNEDPSSSSKTTSVMSSKPFAHLL